MVHELLKEKPASGCKCSGGKGRCENEPVAIVRTIAFRRALQLTQRRTLCKRCLVGWVARHILRETFDPPQWVLDLIVLPRTREEQAVPRR